MGDFLAISITFISIIILLGLFYYVYVYTKIKQLITKIPKGIRKEDYLKPKTERLIDKHEQKVIRNKPPTLPLESILIAVDGVMQAEFKMKSIELSFNDFFITDNLDELVVKLSTTIYCDLGVSLIHDLEYYYDKDFIIKYISLGCRDFINEVLQKK